MTKSERSRHMAKIRGDSLKPEKAMEAALKREELAFERNPKDLPGKPDFVLQRPSIYRPFGLAVFVDGCYWHKCPVHGTVPKTRTEWWREKFRGNRARDRRNDRQLRRAGFVVVRLWECAVKADPGVLAQMVSSVKILGKLSAYYDRLYRMWRAPRQALEWLGG